MTKKTALWIMIAFYLFAGLNHFINPGFYRPIIPPYMGTWADGINNLAGFLEIFFALMLIPKFTRPIGSYFIILMLVAFIPSHVYFIMKGEFQLGPFTITPLLAWIRLLIIHPLLILWAHWIRDA